MEAPPINEQQIQQLLIWVDSVPLSRTPKNIARDFSDGVLLAELLHNNFPEKVHLHNYQPANSSAAKYMNWKTLNQKVFKKLNYQVNRHDIESVINAENGAIQRVLYQIYTKVIYNQNRLANQNQLLESKQNPRQMNTQNQKNFKKLADTYQYAKQLSKELAEKQEVIAELRETIQILETKFKKIEQLNRLKDAKIDSLMRKIDENIGI